jgi:hypothetical protein
MEVVFPYRTDFKVRSECISTTYAQCVVAPFKHPPDTWASPQSVALAILCDRNVPDRATMRDVGVIPQLPATAALEGWLDWLVGWLVRYYYSYH